MHLSTVLDGIVLVWRKLCFGRCDVTVLDEEVTDVAFHSEAACAFSIVPGKVDASVFRAFPVLCDGVMLLQNRAEVLGMVLPNVFDAKPHLWRQRLGIVSAW